LTELIREILSQELRKAYKDNVGTWAVSIHNISHISCNRIFPI